jgi:hypothetical protein
MSFRQTISFMQTPGPFWGMLRNDEEGCQEDTRGDGVRASASKLQI